jgi:hypothetical protein
MSIGYRLLTILVMVMIVITEVSVMVVVPAMIVFNPASISLPIACKELFPIVMWGHPTSTLVRWASPITLMPLIV